MTGSSHNFKTLGLGLISTLLFYSCSTSSPQPGGITSAPAGAQKMKSRSNAVADAQRGAPSIEAQDRPGLGTGWGKEKSSKIKSTSFVRESTKPYGKVESIYYNDEEGVDAMAGNYRWGSKGLQKSANGLVEWGVKQGVGTLKSYFKNGKRFIEGKEGRTYSIVIKNVCHSRLEAVVSVDGLDVLNGRSASLSIKGYIINPGDSLTIKGFRTSREAVAAFKFSSVSESYSQEKYGTSRNVGVIGLALFTEKGFDPWKWSTRELNTREDASPFAEAAR